MKAWLIREPGGPDQFSCEQIAQPQPRDGWVLIRVRSFGVNRSEWFTRRGDSPTVKFPRVLGIECVGEVVDGGGIEHAKGARVAANMGGMGRQFDGSYAEWTCVPRECDQLVAAHRLMDENRAGGKIVVQGTTDERSISAQHVADSGDPSPPPA